MSRAILAAILLLALWLDITTRAEAGGPDPTLSDVPDLITLVGRTAGGVADPLGVFAVVPRDRGGAPHQGWDVVLDFSQCPDIRLAADQDDPRVTVNCAGRSLSEQTDINRSAIFRVIGSANNPGASPGSTGPCLNVYSQGVFLKSVRVAAFDQNGHDGLDSGDLSLFLTDYLSGRPFARSDYDGDGTLTAKDLSRWLTAFFAGGSVVSGAPCP